MATGTLIFRPTADVSVNHSKSSGSSGYALISDVIADDDSSYIYHTLSSTSTNSVNSTFTLSGDLPESNIKITAARLYSRATKSGNGETASYTCYFAAGTASGGSSSDAGTSATLTTSYVTTNTTSSKLVDDINSLLESDEEFPIISVKVTTTGAKSSGKLASDGYARITQIYAEFDYEEIEVAPDIPSEDPDETYYSLTISSINANTTPKNGTSRVVEGSNETIIVYPSDPKLTMAMDNGVDITDQLIWTQPSNTYSVTTKVSGATYGFELDSASGYYESTNNGRSNSASVARINMEFETACLVTLTYINYAEATYDYGIFGNIDTALGTSYSADSNARYACSARTDNSASAKTITYEVPSGSHFIDIKYLKDSATDSNNDSLQWKITSVEPVGGGGNYTYTLTNITRKHSLIFIFGDVEYYFVSSSSTGCRLFPDGKQVKLPNDSYNLTIVPDDINATVLLYDNGVDKTSSLVRTDTTDKGGNPVATYAYEINSINEDHSLNIGCSSSHSSKIFVKDGTSWISGSKVYIKINGSWVEQNVAIWSAVFDETLDYSKMN